MAYLGKTPSQAVRSRYYFTATGGETSLSGADDNANTLTFTDGNYVDVALNGVTLVAGTDYNTTTANTIGGLTALVASDVVEVIVYDTFSVFGGNMAANLNFKDNVKANFGTGNDLVIYHDGSNSIINDAGTGSLKFQYGGTDGVVFDSSGNVGIGVASPAFTTGSGLEIERAGAATLRLEDTGSGGKPLEIYSDDGEGYVINGLSSGMPMIFKNNNSEAMRIDSSGNVGIGTSSPNDYANYVTLTLNDTNGAEIDFEKAGTVNGSLFTPSGTSDFQVTAANASGNLIFSAGSYSEKMRLDNNGNVGIGTTSPSAKLQAQNDSSTAYNPSTAAFNTILNVKNSTSGASNNALMAFTTESNGEWYIGGVQNSGNTAADFVFASRDSGVRAERLRILSSGGITFNGDTAAANALDDYEEGTWTPQMNISGSNVTTTINSAVYNKIGNFVYAHASINFASGTSTGAVQVLGLPFTSGGTYYSRGLSVNDFVDNPERYYMYVSGTTGVLRVGGITQGTGSRDLNGNDILDNTNIAFYFHIFYRTA